MRFTPLLSACLALPTALATAAVSRRGTCTSHKRIAGAKIVPYAYNLVPPGESAAAFETLPLDQACQTFVMPNGAPAVQVAVDAATTVDFAIETRQAFSKVVSTYTDYADGHTVMHANITLGLLHTIALPIVFHAEVTLTYDLATCLITEIYAVATIPTEVFGMPVSPPTVPSA